MINLYCLASKDVRLKLDEISNISEKDYLYKIYHNNSDHFDYLFKNNVECNKLIYLNSIIFSLSCIFFLPLVAMFGFFVIKIAKNELDSLKTDVKYISSFIIITLLFISSKLTNSYYDHVIVDMLKKDSNALFSDILLNFNFIYFSPLAIEYLKISEGSFIDNITNIVRGYYFKYYCILTYIYPLIFLIFGLFYSKHLYIINIQKEDKYKKINKQIRIGLNLLLVAIIMIVNYFAVKRFNTWLEILKYFFILVLSFEVFGGGSKEFISDYYDQTEDAGDMARLWIAALLAGVCLVYLEMYFINGDIFFPGSVLSAADNLQSFLNNFCDCHSHFGNFNLDKKCQIKELKIDANQILQNGEVLNIKTNINFNNNINVFENINIKGIDIARQVEILYNILIGNYQAPLKKGSIIIKYIDLEGKEQEVDLTDLSFESLRNHFLFLSSKTIIPNGLNIKDVVSLTGDITDEELDKLLKRFLLNREIVQETDNSHLSGGQRKRLEELMLHKAILNQQKNGIQPIVLLHYYSRGVDYQRQKILLTKFYKFAKKKNLKIIFLPELQEGVLFNEILKEMKDTQHKKIKLEPSVIEEKEEDHSN